jgi:hypothetical protein
MPAPSLTYRQFRELNPCEDSLKRVRGLFGGARRWNSHAITAQAAADAGCTFRELLWVASALARKDLDVRRRVQLFGADCAAHVLHLFEQAVPDDNRVRMAIVASRQYARGIITIEALYAEKSAAWGAAMDAAALASPFRRGTSSAAASRVASSAWCAAIPPDALAQNITSSGGWRDAAARAAEAVALTGEFAHSAALDAAYAVSMAHERAWQLDRLVALFSDPEPDDVALPDTKITKAA